MRIACVRFVHSFNTQPRGGGCDHYRARQLRLAVVSTHSRAEAAASHWLPTQDTDCVSTHSSAEAAAYCEPNSRLILRVSTHSRAEAAARQRLYALQNRSGFNTQPRGGGCRKRRNYCMSGRSFNTQPRGGGCGKQRIINQIKLVSTHSRAEAAAALTRLCWKKMSRFNTQPRGGGCINSL